MASGRAGTGWFLTGELQNASLRNAPLGKLLQVPFAHPRIGVLAGKLAVTALEQCGRREKRTRSWWRAVDVVSVGTGRALSSARFFWE